VTASQLLPIDLERLERPGERLLASRDVAEPRGERRLTHSAVAVKQYDPGQLFVSRVQDLAEHVAELLLLFDASQKYVIVDVNRIARFRSRFKLAAFTHSRAPSLFIACLPGNHGP
jgi:hypothetical protein